MLLNEARSAYTKGELSVGELARRVNRSRQTIWRIMNGHVDPPLSLAQALADEAAKMLAEAPRTTTPAQPDVAPITGTDGCPVQQEVAR